MKQGYSQQNIENALSEMLREWVGTGDIETASDTFWDMLNRLSVQSVPTNRDEKIQAVVDLKERKTDLLREEAEWAIVFTADNDAGGMASCLVTSAAEIKMWAKVYELFGPQGIDDLAPLKPDWWRAILKCPNPVEALREALDLELSEAQIKERWNLVKHREPPSYKGAAKVKEYTEGRFAAFLELGVDAPDPPPEKVHITIKIVE